MTSPVRGYLKNHITEGVFQSFLVKKTSTTFD